MTAWLTPAEAAEIAGFSTKAVARWADAGHIGVGRTRGGHRRYAEADIRQVTQLRAAGRCPAGHDLTSPRNKGAARSDGSVLCTRCTRLRRAD